jgi:CheY-like chemotaxis protein
MSSKLVLIAEDDPALAGFLAQVLALQGHQGVMVLNGREVHREALRLCPDLILLDMGLPTLDGLSVTQQLKSDPLLSHIPVVAVSAHSSQEEAARAAGCSAFLAKPFGLAELEAVVGQYLEPTKA